MTSYINIKTPISCHDSCDGVLEVVLFESDWDFITWGAPESYSWVLNSGTPHVTSSSIINGCCDGIWEVTVSTTFGGGHSIGPITEMQLNGSVVGSLANPTVISGTITTVNVTCSGGSNGILSVNPSGGTGIYTYLWTKVGSGFASTSQTISNLSYGTYDLTITDSNGCTGTLNGNVVTVPDAILPNWVATDASCPNGSNGSVEFFPSGGTGPYTISFNDSAFTSTTLYTGLTQTADFSIYYPYVIKDTNGCTTSLDYVFLTNPVADWVVTSTVIQPTETTLGSISLLVSGATGPYTYLWNTGATTNSITNLNQGTYTVTISDTQPKGNPCTTTRTYVLSNSCPNLTFSEFKVFIMRTQCCFGKKVQQHNSLIRQGRQDLADCILPDLMLLEMILKRFYCIEDIQKDICWSCQDLDTLMTKVKNICECDCCEEDQENIVQVNYNPITNLFDVIN